MKALVSGREYEVLSLKGSWLIDNKPAPEILKEWPGGRYLVRDENKVRIVIIHQASSDGKKVEVTLGQNSIPVRLLDRSDAWQMKEGSDASKDAKQEVRAPMPGLILNVFVQPGDMVQAGEPLLVLEAMKMENLIKAPSAGTIREVNVSKGDRLEKGQVMVKM